MVTRAPKPRRSPLPCPFCGAAPRRWRDADWYAAWAEIADEWGAGGARRRRGGA